MLVRETLRKVLLPAVLLFSLAVVLLYFYHTRTLKHQIEEPSVVDIPNVYALIPDFSRYSDVSQKKYAFFEFMLPMVQRENERLSKLRSELFILETMYAQNGRLNARKRKWLYDLANIYRLGDRGTNDGQLLRQLLDRVDSVPVSLALSQSANESAWGTSRFALLGNNLFGQWCFSKGCGVVPLQRPEGASYEVASFSAPADSVKSYIHNLNTNSAYAYFRELRTQMRVEQNTLSGEILAEGLVSYSTRGDEYIAELQAMIRVNQLSQYDRI